MDKITDLDYKESMLLLEELKPLDTDVNKKVFYLIQNLGLSIQEALDYVVNDSPLMWSKVYLNWNAKEYQKVILQQGKEKLLLVLRLGRRLGKTECDCILTLWYAIRQPNPTESGQYNILIIAPFEAQVKLIFDRLKQLIYSSELLTSMITRDIQNRIEFSNGTIITGMTAGSKNNTGAANTRGQHANLIILDECDYMGSEQISNIINIRNEYPTRIKIIATSTPCGKHEEYYHWCVDASYHYRVKKEDMENFRFTGYEYCENKDKDDQGRSTGNGWTEVFAPSIVNEKLLEVNQDTGLTYLEELRSQLSEMRFLQEVMAEFGEQETGVYSHELIDAAIDEGKRVNLKYVTEMEETEAKRYKDRRGVIRILGCDWDKSQTGTHMVIVEFDKRFKNNRGEIEPKFKIIYHEEIPKSQFTYLNATDRIKQLNEEYHLNHIAIDKGYGEVQIELLHKYGMEHPESGILNKLRAYQFSEKIEVTDPFTNKKDKKPLKPFMVTNSVILFERGKIVLNPRDKVLKEQFEQYTIKSTSSTGLPIYSDENEHSLDCVNMALLNFALNYDSLFKTMIRTTILGVRQLISNDFDEVKSRDIEKTNPYKLKVVGPKLKPKVLDLGAKPKKKSRMKAMCSRRGF